MLFSLAIYLRGQRHLPREAARRRAAQDRQPLTGSDLRGVLALITLCLPVVFFWATYEQQGNTISLWADGFTDRHVSLGSWEGEIPTTWFQSLNPFMIFAFTPLVVGFWAWQAKKSAEPSTIVKMALGCLCVALANLVLAFAAWHAGDGVKASWLWLFLYFAIVTTGELYLSPIGLSLVSKIAPRQMLSLLMGVWLATSFVGNLTAGWLGGFWSGMEKTEFFLMIAAIAGAAAVVIAAFNRPLRSALGE
jgi:POT family proton-dependent oligopeptide transporter